MALAETDYNYLVAENNLKEYFREQSLNKLLSTVATNLLKHRPDWLRRQIHDCIQKSTSIHSYSRCLVPLIKTHQHATVDDNIEEENQENTFNSFTSDGDMISKNQENNFNSFTFNGDIISNQLFQSMTPKPILSNDHFTLSPAEDEKVTTEKPLLQKFGEIVLGMIQKAKAKHGPWFKFPKLDQIRYRRSLDSDSVSDAPANPLLDELYEDVNSVLSSPMVMLKNNFDQNQNDQISSVPAEDITFDILSPRVMPLMDRGSDRISLLSPDILSFYEGGKNNFASLSNLLFKLSENERKPWVQFISEINGVADTMRYLKTTDFSKLLESFKINMGGLQIPITSTFEILTNTLGDIIKLMTPSQMSNMNSKGYTYLNAFQIDKVYGKKWESLNMEPEKFSRLSEEEKDALLLQDILNLAYEGKRRKRQTYYPSILTSFVGAPILRQRVLRPRILNPPVLSPNILGPLVLSPVILSPAVLSPFIFSPRLVSPPILSPNLIGPTILSPLVLSPLTVSPNVLSPFILSPFVLNPAILNPTVLTPNILAPAVLSARVLSPSVLGPRILSPGVMNPSILSPSALSPSILSPNALSPPVLSPGIYSPAVLSPCFLCRKQLKKV